jgi:cytochrome b
MTDIAKPTDVGGARDRGRLWDLPIRLFHWSLVLLIAAAWWTARERALEWHRLAGYAILTLVVFRISWGLWGSTTARFTHFVVTPRALLTYLGDLLAHRTRRRPGHNPLGGWSVIAMLGAIAAQIVLGLFAVDIDGMESGPLSYLVDFDTGRIAAETHAIGFNLLVGLIILHLAAILAHGLLGRTNLLPAMLHGRAPRDTPVAHLRFGSNRTALLLLVASAAAVWLFVRYAG